jgi:quinoprotein glucose dehydrogenase
MLSIKILSRSLTVLLFVCCALISCAQKPEEKKITVSQKKVAAPKNRLNNDKDWGIYKGDLGGTHYSSLDQINTQNVSKLVKVWEYHHGNPTGPGMYANPIIIDGLLYFTTPEVNAVALDAATGKEVWVFKPNSIKKDRVPFKGRNRGLTYWEDANGKNKRILNFVKDRVYALDPKTGALITSFGENGFIDLRKNMVQPPEKVDLEMTTQGIVYGNMLIVGGRVQEGRPTSPGDVRGYDALTGQYKWIFHTVPQPGEFGYDTWEFEKDGAYGGANPWGGFTVDEKRGWVFFATGSAAPDIIYGGTRKGQNLFSNCVVALEANTGKRIWHYQTVHHDIFDYDAPPAPMLLTVTSQGKARDIVVQLTKQGLTFVLDRDTGKPVFEVKETPVAASTVPGEKAWPTQPIPTLPPPLNRTEIRESDLSNIDPETHKYVLELFRKHETGPQYTPASLKGVITMPGHQGGVEWGGGAFDPKTNVMYVNVNEAPTIHSLVPLKDGDPRSMTPIQRGGMLYNTNCTACHGVNKTGNKPFPALTNIKITDDSIKAVITNGRSQMPMFKQFTNRQLNELVAYLRNTDPAAAEIKPAGPPDPSKAPDYASTIPFFLDQNGLPAIAPPWGTMTAVDLDKGKILWQVPLGDFPEALARGIKNAGSKSFGGPAVTAGNLVFMAGTPDEKIRAFDKNTGKVLWEAPLPAGGYASPSVYMINGKQYVAICAGGVGKNGTKAGDSVVAFALPD